MTTKNKSRTGRPTKSVTMRESNETEIQINQNTVDILLMKKDISEIKNNHLKHIEEDIKKIDGRLWWIVGLILASLMGTLFL